METQLTVHQDSNHEGNFLTLSARTVDPSSKKVWDLEQWVGGTEPSSHLPGVPQALLGWNSWAGLGVCQGASLLLAVL